MNRRNCYTCIYHFFDWGRLTEFKNEENNPWYIFKEKKNKTSNKIVKKIQKYWDEIVSQL